MKAYSIALYVHTDKGLICIRSFEDDEGTGCPGRHSHYPLSHHPLFAEWEIITFLFFFESRSNDGILIRMILFLSICRSISIFLMLYTVSIIGIGSWEGLWQTPGAMTRWDTLQNNVLELRKGHRGKRIRTQPCESFAMPLDQHSAHTHFHLIAINLYFLSHNISVLLLICEQCSNW